LVVDGDEERYTTPQAAPMPRPAEALSPAVNEE
jgi:hypothetical protein